MNGSIREFITFLQLRNTPAKSIDHFVCATDVAKHADRAMLLIRLASLTQIVHMCRDANHVLCVPNQGKTYAGALYSDVSKFPVARFYHLCLDGDLFAGAQMFSALSQQGFQVKIPRPDALSELIQEEGWNARLANHLEYRNVRIRDYEKVRSGRSRNTITDSGFFLNSTGCLVCDGPPDFLASMTVAADAESAHMTSVRLCAAHMEKARESSSLANYLASTFGIPFILDSLKRSASEVLSDAVDVMRTKLEMDVFDQGTENIKARTKKGTVLIYRYESELNYGYMINGAQNEKLARIDSANHHHVEVGPDHLHPDLQKKAPPVSSFTTGDLCLDWPLIRSLIEDWESR